MISIVIPSMNNDKYIGLQLDALMKQDYKGEYEIIVVDSSTDNSKEVISKFPVRLINQPPLGISAARNTGARMAKGDIIVFTDSDCVPQNDWLTEMMKPFSDKSVYAVGGAYKNALENSRVARYIQQDMEKWNHDSVADWKTMKVRWTSGYSYAIRKDVFDDLGYFDESLKEAEDIDFAVRVARKYKTVYQPSAYVYHYHVDTMKRLIRQKFKRSSWRAAFYWKSADRIGSISALTVFKSLTMISFVLVSIFGMQYALPYYHLIVGAVLLITYAFSLSFLSYIVKNDPSLLPSALVILPISTFCTIFGFMYGAFRGLKQRIFRK